MEDPKVCRHALGFWEGTDEAALVDVNSDDIFMLDMYALSNCEPFAYCPRCGQKIDHDYYKSLLERQGDGEV